MNERHLMNDLGFDGRIILQLILVKLFLDQLYGSKQ